MKKIFKLMMMTLLAIFLQHPSFANDVNDNDCCSDSNITVSSQTMLDNIQMETELLHVNDLTLQLQAQEQLKIKKQELTLMEKIQVETQELSLLKPIFIMAAKFEPLKARRLQ